MAPNFFFGVPTFTLHTPTHAENKKNEKQYVVGANWSRNSADSTTATDKQVSAILNHADTNEFASKFGKRVGSPRNDGFGGYVVTWLSFVEPPGDCGMTVRVNGWMKRDEDGRDN